MQKRDKKWSKLLISICSFFAVGFFLQVLWNVSLLEEIKGSRIERKDIKKNIEKVEALEKINRNFTRDVLRQKAIGLCFWELIGEHTGKYNAREIQDCIRLIAMADEKYGTKGLDAALVLAWLEKESDGNPEAVSYAGAKGLTQLMDFRAEEVLTAMGYPGYDRKLVFNPVINLEGGLNHLEDLMNFWELEGVKNQYLILFYAVHSYKWGSQNTVKLFNTERSAYRPAIRYVNWILNRQEYWAERLKYWIDGPQNPVKERQKKLGLETVQILSDSDE